MATLTDIEQQIAQLEAEKKKIIENQKKAALKTAQDAVAALNTLGFNYQLVEAGSKTTRTRRPGVRDSVLKAVQSSDGVTPAQIADQLNMTDKAGKQSIANALTALKKKGDVTADAGVYRKT